MPPNVTDPLAKAGASTVTLALRFPAHVLDLVKNDPNHATPPQLWSDLVCTALCPNKAHVTPKFWNPVVAKAHPDSILLVALVADTTKPNSTIRLLVILGESIRPLVPKSKALVAARLNRK